MNHTCLCLPSRSWYSFTNPGGMEGWVGLGGEGDNYQWCMEGTVRDWLPCDRL